MPSERRVKLVPRKTVKFKTIAALRSKKKLSKNRIIRALETERTSLFHQNTNIAIALNNSKEDNAALFSQMNKLKGEILQLQTELAAYRTKYDYMISNSPKSSSELDTKLENRLETPRNLLFQARDQLEDLSLAINSAIKSMSIPGSFKPSCHIRKRDSTSPDVSKRPVTLENNRRNGSGSVAHIAPRVAGVEIRKPMVRLPKMSIADLSNMATALRDSEAVNILIDQSEEESRESQILTNGGEEISQGEPQQISEVSYQRNGIRRRQREYPSPTIEPLIEEDEGTDQDLRLLTSRVSINLPALKQETTHPPKRGRRSSTIAAGAPLTSGITDRKSVGAITLESRSSRASGSLAKPDHQIECNTSLNINESSGQATSRVIQGSSNHRLNLRRRSTISTRLLVPQIRLEVASEDSELHVTSTSLNTSEQTLENNQIESDTSKKSDSINFCPSNKGASNYHEASQEDESFADPWYAIDPLEGPSWLFEESERAETLLVRESNLKSSKVTSIESSASDALSMSSGSNYGLMEPSTSFTLSIPAPSIPALSPQVNSFNEGKGGSSHSISSIGDQKDQTECRSRRRAATAAISSLKEPSMNKKLRQGDPISNSIYKDFVPNEKGKEKRKTSNGKSGRKQSK